MKQSKPLAKQNSILSFFTSSTKKRTHSEMLAGEPDTNLETSKNIQMKGAANKVKL